jgi:hypothetical protein
MMSSGKIWLQYSQRLFVFSPILLSVLMVATVKVGVRVECVVTELMVLWGLTSMVLNDSSTVNSDSEVCSLTVSNIAGISVLIAECEPGTATEVVVLKVEAGTVAVNISIAHFEIGAIIPILVTGGTPTLRTKVVSAANGVYTPVPIKELAVEATTESVVWAPKLTASAVVATVPIVTPVMALLIDTLEVTELVTSVTVASEAKPLA